MYIRTNVDEFPGYGIAPAAAVELGAAVLTFGKDLFTGGDFSTSSNVLNYMHDNTPLEQKFISPPCRQRILIAASKPGSGAGPLFAPALTPLQRAKQRLDYAEKFWFELSYEYNGNDLRNVGVEPLVNESSTLHKSQFKITFTGNTNSVPRDPVAEVVFRISGTWKAWDPIPFRDTIVSFSGNLYVRADGVATVKNFTSEEGLVWLVVMHPDPLYGCPVKLPYKPVPPKPPVRKPFSLAILFPFAKDTVSESEARRMYEWVNSWPATTRDKIARGEITVSIAGLASRPGKGLYNLGLSERRAENVKNILRKFTGSNTKFDIRSYGTYSQSLIQQLLRVFDPNKFDQAAIIQFEDVE